MTTEDLILALHKDVLAIRETMATKSDLAALREQMATKQDLADLRDEMNARFATHSELQPVKEEILEELRKIKYAKEIDELRVRVQRLERQVGIAPARRAA